MTPSPNSNELRDFLLDRLPPEQAEAIEERMFQDEATFSDIEDAEDELIEEFVMGALDAADEKAFAARVERDPSLRDRVAFRRGLVRALQSVPTVSAAVSQPRRRSWFLVPGFAVAIAILFVVAYTAEHRSGAPTRAPGSGPTETRQNTIAQAVLFLPAHVARGAAQKPSVLRIGSANVVKLELETASAATRWDVQIAGGGASIFSANGLRAQQAGVVSYVVAEVMASALPPKTYQIILSPESSSGEAVSTSWDLQVVK